MGLRDRFLLLLFRLGLLLRPLGGERLRNLLGELFRQRLLLLFILPPPPPPPRIGDMRRCCICICC